MTPEDVYMIYGKPERIIPISNQVKSQVEQGKPFIVDMGKAGQTIYYPADGLSFEVFNGMVESRDITSKVKR